MTEATPIDVSGKIISNAKPAAPSPAGPPGAGKPPEKPSAKGATGDAPPAPGSKTFLGWVAGGFSRKQLTVAVAALCSLGAGIAAVWLIWPKAEQPTSATQALVSDPTAAPETPVTPPRTGPTLTLEPARPAEFIPPASLPMSPVSPGSPTTKSGAIPPPSSLDTLPAIPSAPPAALAPARPPAIAPPESLVPAVLPAGGTDNKPPSTPATASLPLIPSTPPSSLPAAPPSGALLPALPGPPASTPPAPMNLDPRPPAPVVGMAPTPTAPPASLVPSVGDGPKPPAAPAELSPMLPAIPGPSGAKPTDSKLEFVKPAESSTVTPAAATRAPTTSYDVDIYHPKANDSWEAISREYFSDPKYAAALRTYNQNRALAPGRDVDVPPLHVLRRMAPPPVTGTPATRSTPPLGDNWNAAGVGTVSARTYRVPPGDGMSLPAVAKLVLGNDQRWQELYQLNPDVNPSKVSAGTEIKLPADARVQ